MYKNIFSILAILLITAHSYSQCVVGDCKNGYGVMNYSDGKYEGFWTNGLMDKIGLMSYNDGRLYFGEFENGKFSGYGSYTWKDKQNHIGSWKNGLQDGQGVFLNTAKNPTSGIWTNGKLTAQDATNLVESNPLNCQGNCIDGYGKLTLSNNEFIQGRFIDKNAVYGHIRKTGYAYDGNIKNDLPHGYGQMGYTNGDHFFGYFEDGKKHGFGIFTPKGKPRYYGFWVNDEYRNPETFSFKQKDFCDQIISIAALDAAQRNRKIKKILSITESEIDFLFLNTFKIIIRQNNGMGDRIRIHFPRSGSKEPTISRNDLNTALPKCKKLHQTSNNHEFLYNTVTISSTVDHNGSYVQFNYKYEDLECISGDCYTGYGKKVFEATGNSYEGQFKNGKFHGNGTYIWKNGDIYRGAYLNGYRFGKGKLVWSNGNYYDGDWGNGYRTGQGYYFYKETGDSYTGTFKSGNRNGFGIYRYGNGNRYEGNYSDGKRNGQGIFYWNSGDIYDGNWVDGERGGQGKLTFKSGSLFEGHWKNNKRNGYGIAHDKNGLLIYKGNYVNDKYSGAGTLYYSDGSKFVGNFSNNDPNGYGKVFDANGKLIYEGTFKDGKRIK